MSDVFEIPDFAMWCVETERELPVPAGLLDTPEGEKATAENRKRTGAKEGLYPAAYFAGQYCDLWKVPAAADASYYQAVAQGKKVRP